MLVWRATRGYIKVKEWQSRRTDRPSAFGSLGGGKVFYHLKRRGVDAKIAGDLANGALYVRAGRDYSMYKHITTPPDDKEFGYNYHLEDVPDADIERLHAVLRRKTVVSTVDPDVPKPIFVKKRVPRDVERMDKRKKFPKDVERV